MVTRHRIASVIVLAFFFSVLLTDPARGSEEKGLPPDEGGEIESMGQPPLFVPYGGLAAGVYRPSSGDGPAVAAGAHVGLFKPLTSPIAAIGIAGEAYVGARGSAVDGGVRVLAALRPFGFAVGFDYSIAGNDPDLILSFTRSFWRGGLFRMGDMFRLNYLPTRDHTVTLGYQIPLGDTWMGRTRPKSDRVKLFEPEKRSPKPQPPEDAALTDALARVGHAVEWQVRCVAPFLDQHGDTRDEIIDRLLARLRSFQEHAATRDDAYPSGHGCPDEIRVYHAELDRAFSLAASAGALGRALGESSEAGRRISAQAREILLDELILPYNRELGRIKDPDTTRGFAARARESLLLWLNQSGAAPPSTHAGVLWVYQQLLDRVEASRRMMTEAWETSQLGWLPIRLAKRPEELETQAQLDALVERAVGQEFTRGNEHHYIVNEKFQWELLRHIRAAEDYHVLWIHDYRGRNSAGGSDRIGFDQVYHGYLRALIERVRAYDTTGKLPVYMIFLDQNFYEPNAGRTWMSFLEDPLHHRVALPGGADSEEQESKIREAQAELREAVASSRLLQERRRSYGDDWLANRIKVHVNITNPVDWSFWSQQIIPVLGVPDVLMRDHRKISFYDVTETDPSKGEAIFTGMGIGEHYAGPTWEDRAILVQGPSLVGLKDAARELVLSQGFAEDEVPYPLRPLPRPANYGELVAARVAAGIDYRAMQIHNQTGYAPKQINVYKALLYDAMPEGSILIVPDSLWNSPFWASMLLGNAVRGGRVYIISPALENAPSAGFPQMSRAQELYCTAPGREADDGPRDRPPGWQPEPRHLRRRQGRRRSPRAHLALLRQADDESLHPGFLRHSRGRPGTPAGARAALRATHGRDARRPRGLGLPARLSGRGRREAQAQAAPQGAARAEPRGGGNPQEARLADADGRVPEPIDEAGPRSLGLREREGGLDHEHAPLGRAARRARENDATRAASARHRLPVRGLPQHGLPRSDDGRRGALRDGRPGASSRACSTSSSCSASRTGWRTASSSTPCCLPTRSGSARSVAS